MPKETKPHRTMISGSVGRKVLMALTGLCMVLFLAAHLAGNSTIWSGPESINSYAQHLHRFTILLWPLRAIMLLVLGTHIFLGITLTLENRKASHGKYAVTTRQKTTFSGRTMIWTGLFLLLFLFYHLLHFTFRLVPGPVVVPDGIGRMDVYSMIISGFLDRAASAVYVTAMAALFLHTGHGVGSIFQTLGIANDRTLPGFSVLGRLVSAVFLVGFGMIPILVAVNFLN